MTFTFRSAAVITAIAALAACSTDGAGNYRPNGHAVGSSSAAFAQCDYEANVATASNKGTTELDQAVSDTIVSNLAKSRLLKKCMQAKGFTQR